MEIVGWNIAENRVWYVRINSGAATSSVSLHRTEEDARDGANPVVLADGVPVGSSVPVTFSGTAVEKFVASTPWHLMISVEASSGIGVLRVDKFDELPEISDPIYRNVDLISDRAMAEIDKATHKVIRYDLQLASFAPTWMQPGKNVTVKAGRVVQSDTPMMVGSVEIRVDRRGTHCTLGLQNYLPVRKG